MNTSGIDFEAGFMLGHWRVEPAKNAICRDGKEVHLENRLMQTLVFLARNQGQVVRREQFFDVVWKGLVVNEEALSRAISLLRNMLGDSAQAPKFIKTVPGIGYCLIAEVSAIEKEPPRPPGPGGEDGTRSRSFTGYKWGLLVLVLVLGYIVIDHFLWESRDDSTPVTVTTGARDDNSVAVLPFVNMSSDPEQDYFADGMTEEILNLLAGVSNLRVPARTSSFFFKDQDMPVSRIANILNVKHVLEGSVRKSGDRVRITAQLIDANSDKHLWSETYDRQLEDVLSIQDEVATAIAGSLVKSFHGLESRPVSRASSLATFEAYRTGRLLWWRRSPEDLNEAIELFNRAIEHDPGFAPAYAAVGDSWLLMVLYGKVQIIKGVDKARPMIEKALELDPESAEAIAARGLMLLMIGEKDQAERDLRQAIKLDREYIPAYAWLSALLNDLGRMPEEAAVLQEALAHDPLNTILTGNYAANLMARGDAEGAKALVQSLLRLQPDLPVLLVQMSELDLDSGNLVGAWSNAEHAYEQAPENTTVIIALAKAWMDLDEFDEAEQVLKQGLRSSPGNVNIKLQYLKLLDIQGRVDEAQELKDNLFPEDISWLPDAMQRTYHYETGILNLVREDWVPALEHLEQALNPAEIYLYDEDQVTTLTLVSLLHRGMGNEQEAEKRLQMAERVIGHARVNGIEDAESYYQVACIFAMRGEIARALHALQQAYDRGMRKLWLLEIDGRLDPLRQEPEFMDLLKQVEDDVTRAREKVRAIE